MLVSERENDGEGGACQYLSLLPQSMLMTAEESKTGRNLTRTKLFGQGNNCKELNNSVHIVSMNKLRISLPLFLRSSIKICYG